MKQPSTGWALGPWFVLGGVVTSLAAVQTATPLAEVTVRVTTIGSASARDVIEMEQTASAIFRKAGIGVKWRACWIARTPCKTVEQLDELDAGIIRLRIFDSSNWGEFSMLGWVTPGSSAATIVYKHARQIAVESNFEVSPGIILGHAAAHEMGHVLLRSSHHDPSGVMKKTFVHADILQMAQGRPLLFTAEESKLLRSRLASSQLKQTSAKRPCR